MSNSERNYNSLATGDRSKPVTYEIKKGDLSILKSLLKQGVINQRVFDQMSQVVMRRDVKVRVLFGCEIITPLEED